MIKYELVSDRKSLIREYVSELKRCGKEKDLQRGKLLHLQAVQTGFHTNIYVASTLVSMYSRCGSLQEARRIFQEMAHRDVVSWNVLMFGYVENGESLQALKLFESMDCPPNCTSFVAALKACAQLTSDRETRLQHGVNVHRYARSLGLERDLVVASALVDMYCKCGDMQRARCVFDGMAHRDTVSWNILIHGYTENGESFQALQTFKGMNCPPDSLTFVAALKACVALEKESCLLEGMKIHSEVKLLGLERDISVANTLIEMYSRLGDVPHARKVFDGMHKRDSTSWTALLHSYVENGEIQTGLKIFYKMDCPPTRASVVLALKACNGLTKERKLRECLTIKKIALQFGFIKDVLIANLFIDMFGRCGDMVQACAVFQGMTQRNVVSWTSLMNAYLENENESLALEVFEAMDCQPDGVAFGTALKACSKLNRDLGLQTGVTIHKRARELGFEKELLVGNTLVDMYSKCGDMQRAHQAFDGMSNRDTVSWNVLTFGYVENGESSKALEMFTTMDCPPDRLTFVAVLRACVGEKKGWLEKVHDKLRELGLESDTVVANTLVDVYSKGGDMLQAREVFDGMKSRDIVSWNVLIGGYVLNGDFMTALEVFTRMDFSPNRVTFVAVLKACGGVGALELGQAVHDRVCECELEQDEVVSTSLVDFYGKCGDMAAAQETFDRRVSRSTASWNALLGGYVLLGRVSEVFGLLKRMEESGVRMNEVTVQLVITACSHAGLVDEARSYFDNMLKLGVTPTVEHYGCMVDMLGRANKLEEALGLARWMPFAGNGVVWTSLLGACKKWNNVKVGEAAFKTLMALNESEESVAAACVLMRSIYESTA